MSEAREREIKLVKIQTTGVIGAGVMGRGVAHAQALAGLRVILIDLSDEVLERARRGISQDVRAQRLLRGGASAVNSQELLSRIVFTTDYGALEEADFVVENVTEKTEVKQGVYGQLDAVCRARCIFAANTSAIPITRIASWTTRPDRVIGMHFMNPVPLKPMVEVIRGRQTSDETVEAAASLLAAMGKQSVVVNDSPGFVSNRVLMLTVNEAVFLLEEGVASPNKSIRFLEPVSATRWGRSKRPI
nr:3-hydroxybutyryl-CoA dehydrogenase [uncultured bacterium]